MKIFIKYPQQLDECYVCVSSIPKPELNESADGKSEDTEQL